MAEAAADAMKAPIVMDAEVPGVRGLEFLQRKDKIRKRNFDFCFQIHYMDWLFICLTR